MIISRKLIYLNAGCGMALVLAACGCGAKAAAPRGSRGGGPQVAVSVAVSPAKIEDVPVYLTGLGNVVGYNTVVVKSRIDGQLVEVPIREGQEVQKGQVLALIDPRPYQVALNQAQANLYKDKAALEDAKLNAKRYGDLAKEGVISRQQYDTQAAASGQLEGSVQADQAAIENAKLNLTYTRITAPISGRVGLRQVDPGNMVHASDQNGMFVITQLQPIAVLFTLPEDQLPEVAKHMRGQTLKVEAYSRDDQTSLGTGSLLTIDNQIDPTTGTGRLKAEFANKDRTLWPNQFVNVRLLLDVRKNNVTVPAAAIQRGPQGTYVYLAKNDNTAELRPVQVAYLTGTVAAIGNGLKQGDVVITDGQDKLQTGSKIEIRSANPQGQGRRPQQQQQQEQSAPTQ
ncbi:MAG TPA: efflux RND transporter periplasmic adaptor subunit [Terriglobales bacterium]|nr:efflux RND transporter periplasmic adaptor subunit [Terriglobales bacterium]